MSIGDIHISKHATSLTIPVCLFVKVNFRGASGDVSFNDKGDRVNYTVIMYSGKDERTENVVSSKGPATYGFPKRERN